MSCELYWEHGVLLDERGERDEHRASCLDCQRAHTERDALIAAIAEVDAELIGDPHWQERVWAAIARDATPRWWARPYVSGLSAAAAAAAIWLALPVLRPAPPSTFAERLDIERAGGARRGGNDAPTTGDILHVRASWAEQVWIFADDLLVARCRVGDADGCAHREGELRAELQLRAAGRYQIVIVQSPAIEPGATYDKSLAATVARGVSYEVKPIIVR